VCSTEEGNVFFVFTINIFCDINTSVCLLSGSEFTTDDQCVVSLLKGLCLKHLGYKEEAEHYFTLILCKSVLLFCFTTNHSKMNRSVCGFPYEDLSRQADTDFLVLTLQTYIKHPVISSW